MAKISSLVILFFLSSIPVFAGTRVYGRVVGVDDKPMALAKVYLTYPSGEEPVESADVNKYGEYSLPVRSNGLWMMHFIGLYHRAYTVAVYVRSRNEIKLDVKLETYRYGTNFSRAAIVGNFNRWSISRAVRLEEGADSTYSTTVECNTDTLLYRLINVRTGGDLEGTDADAYVPYGIKGYSSMLTKGRGKFRVTFDPRVLPVSSQPSTFKIKSGDEMQENVAKAFAIFEDARNAYRSSLYWHVAEFKMGQFRYDFTPVIDSVNKLLRVEHNRMLRQILHLDYFGLISMTSFTRFVDVKTSQATLKDIPPGSLIWSLDPKLLTEALDHAAFSRFERKDYVEKVIRENPMERTKAVLLSYEIDRAFHSLQYDDIPPYLTTLLDQYGDSPEAVHDGEVYSGDYIKIKDGAEAPIFSVASLGDTAHKITNESFKGKYFIINFWSVGNRMSEEQIGALSKVYGKYRAKGLQILSVALDSIKAPVVKSFIKRWRVPWLNAIEMKGLDSHVCKSFEVYSIPKAILVNPEGKIVAVGWDLRGPKLLKTLEKYLGK